MLNTKLLINTNLHREAVDWHNRVINNGGVVSRDVLKGISDFCYRIDAASIRHKFYRLNLFCGNNKEASLVPLYIGQSFGGTQYGNPTDALVNFISSDYSQENGYQASASGTGTATKYITTGFAYTSLPSYTDSHIATEVKAISGSTFTTNQWVTGGLLAALPDLVQTLQYRILLAPPTSSGYNEQTIVGATNTITRTNQSIGVRRHIVAVRTANNSQASYNNGGSSQTSLTTISTSTTFHTGARLALFGFWNGAAFSAANFLHIVSNYSIGLGFNATEVSNFYAAISSFNNIIGRL